MGGFPAGEQGPHRGEGVIPDPSGPDEIPQRRCHRLIGRLVPVGQPLDQLAEEVRTPAGEELQEFLLQGRGLEFGVRPQRERRILGEVE